MSKIYYGNGECELEAIDAVFCEIKVKYPIEITDKTPYEFALLTRSGSNKIIIGRIRKGDSTLKELFNYKGDLIITKAVIINKNRDRIRCTLQKVMDYSELLESNSEDLTIKSEDLKAISEISHLTRTESKSDTARISTGLSTRSSVEMSGLLFDGFSLDEAAEVLVYPNFSDDGGLESERTFVKQLVQKYCSDGSDEELFTEQEIDEVTTS